ncbi:50S ribosomal protein L35 [Candidatus Gracilibacteria bacterium]|nr:50S ribosomal protein L35 [Candidatus Gracilibacteria bacterium]
MKAKVHSGAKKRFKLTGTGKIKFGKVAHRHLMVNKSKRQKRSSRKGVIQTHNGEIARIKGLLRMS